MTLNEWQVAEIKKAIAEADRGDFASDKQVKQSLKRLRHKLDCEQQPLKAVESVRVTSSLKR
jgi:hypothetical protein